MSKQMEARAKERSVLAWEILDEVFRSCAGRKGICSATS